MDADSNSCALQVSTMPAQLLLLYQGRKMSPNHHNTRSLHALFQRCSSLVQVVPIPNSRNFTTIRSSSSIRISVANKLDYPCGDASPYQIHLKAFSSSPLQFQTCPNLRLFNIDTCLRTVTTMESNNSFSSRSTPISNTNVVSPSQTDLQKETLLSLSRRAYELSLNDMEKIITHIESNNNSSTSNMTDANGISNNMDNSNINSPNQFILNEQNVEYIHKLMAACAHYKTIQSAELTERFLAAVTLNSYHYDDTNDGYHGQQGEQFDKYKEETMYHQNGPTSKMYSIAMNAWARLPVLKREGNDGHKHNPILAAERAIQILEFMWQEYNNNENENDKQQQQQQHYHRKHTIKPDVIHYTIALNALAKTSSKKAVHLAQSLLDEAEQRSGIQYLLKPLNEEYDNTDTTNASSIIANSKNKFDANLVPDRMCYNTVLYLWSGYSSAKNDDTQPRNKRNRYYTPNEVFDKMNKIIDKMNKLGLVLDDNSWLPNTKSYNLLLRACSFLPNKPLSSSYQDSISEAENIMKIMNEKQSSYPQYSNENLDEELLLELEEDSILPNVHTFNALLQVYAKSVSNINNQDNGHKEDLYTQVTQAREIFKSLLKGAQEVGRRNHQLSLNVQPNLVTINTYLNVLANSGRADAIYEAESLLYFLLNDYDANSNKGSSSISLGIMEDIESREILKSLPIKPDAISYSTVIQGFANCKEVICPGEDAEMIFSRMIEQSEVEEEDGFKKPSKSCYIGLINAWIQEAKIKKDGSKFLNAETILLKMQKDSYYATTSVQNGVLAIAGLNFEDESLKRDVASRARKLLFSMIQRSKNHYQQAEPDIYSFNNVIKANIGFKEEGNKREALFSAIDTFNALNNSTFCEPNDQTYIHMFKILQNSLGNEVEGEALYEELFQKCCKSGLVTNAVLRIIENMVSSTSLRQLKDCKTKKDGKLVVNNLPLEWSKNRRVGQNQRRNRKQSRRRP